jgi:hypothetical protein
MRLESLPRRLKHFLRVILVSIAVQVSSVGYVYVPSSQGAIARYIRKLMPSADYVGNLRKCVTWKKLPVRVFFVRDERYSQSREQFAKRGFNRWVVATEGILNYEITDDIFEADLTVRFDSMTNNGVTSTHFNKGSISRADILIGVQQSVESDIEVVAAHEFGHAMGIDGHSNDKRDLMYPTHQAGTVARVTYRDLNTMASRYSALKRLIARKMANGSTVPLRGAPISRP